MKKEQDYDVEFILPSGREDLTELLRAVIAQKLQGLIKDQTGFSPEIYRDSDKEEGRFEILIGETNHD